MLHMQGDQLANLALGRRRQCAGSLTLDSPPIWLIKTAQTTHQGRLSPPLTPSALCAGLSKCYRNVFELWRSTQLFEIPSAFSTVGVPVDASSTLDINNVDLNVLGSFTPRHDLLQDLVKTKPSSALQPAEKATTSYIFYNESLF